MTVADALQVALGAALVAGALYDLFQSVVLPRPAVGRLRLSPLVLRWGWLGWRTLGWRTRRAPLREGTLAVFGPLCVIVLLVLWAAAIVLGYALVLHGLRVQVRPEPDLGSSLYFSAESFLTLGFGDIVSTDGPARALVILEAATGLGVVALLISLLFSLFASFQRREVAVIALDALAGAPPSGVQLLETCAADGMPAQLERTFDEWRRWTAEVLESHLAYPVLTYFRSSHDNEAWLNSFGAVMDAATLILSAVEHGPIGPARLMLKVGNHLVEDLGWYYRYESERQPLVEREEFREACRRLRASGYRAADSDARWQRFVELRGGYAESLNRLARWLAIAPAPWIGDRSYVPHRDRHHRRPRRPRGAPV